MRQFDPFVSDQEAGMYFWRHGLDDGEAQLSNRAHPLLPHHCGVHGWFSDHECHVDPHGPREARASDDAGVWWDGEA